MGGGVCPPRLNPTRVPDDPQLRIKVQGAEGTLAPLEQQASALVRSQALPGGELANLSVPVTAPRIA